MDPTLLMMLAGLGGYFVYEGLEHHTATSPDQPMQKQTTSKFAPLNGAVSQPLVSTIPPKFNASVTNVGGNVPKDISFVNPQTNGRSASNITGTANGQLLDKAKADIASKYNSLSADEKKKGADALNKLIKPNPGLTGNESFEELGKKVGASLGTAVGGAIGSVIPGVGTAAGAALGAIGGAYLGDKAGAWAKAQWDHIESWAHDMESKVEDKIKSAAHDVTSWVEGII